jgi:DMSO/TMAO reductase YedYZ molybdopterin-dependent catalytic subunit
MDSKDLSISLEELQLAARNHGMPLEALRYSITPVGLHYLLIHYDIPPTEAESWSIELGGLVERPATLSLEALKARDSEELPVTMECAGNGRARLDPRPVSQPWLLEAVGTARWRGARLGPLLEEAGVADGAVEVLFTGADGGREGGIDQQYQRSLSIADVLDSDALLAYEMNGAPLPPQHGFPVRLVVPGWYGMTSVKWLTRIDVLGEPFAGYQQLQSYRLREQEDEEGDPLSRMLPRSLMVPPGKPEFLTRERIVDGPCALEGRAWSGQGEIVGVDVSADGGQSWASAELGDSPGRWAWVGWTYRWEAEAGSYELCCRARDSVGNEQPLEPLWNLGGYANNAVQRVPVTVV